MKMRLMVIGCLVALASGIQVQKLPLQKSDPSSSSDTTDAGTEAPSEPKIGHQCHEGECWNCDYMCDENDSVCAKEDKNCERRFCCRGSSDKCFRDDQCPEGARPELYPGHSCSRGFCWHCDYTCQYDGSSCAGNTVDCDRHFCCTTNGTICLDNCHCPGGIPPGQVAGSRCHEGRCWDCDFKCSNKIFPCDKVENCKGSFSCAQTPKTCTDDKQCLAIPVKINFDQYEDDDDEDDD